jgi:carbon storage regulator
MLVITLKKDEKLLIGKDISVTVVQIRGNDVRVGIDAPSEVVVLREKLVTTQGSE